MRCWALVLILLRTAVAQKQPAPTPESKSVTVPITVNHYRVMVDVDVPLPDGSTKRVHCWVNNGNPDLFLSPRLAKMMGLTLICSGQVCSTSTPLPEILIGGMKVPLSTVKPSVQQNPENTIAIAFPGMSAEISIPSTILRNYDVFINFPGRELTLALPGTINFKGQKTKAIVNSENGLIEIPSQIENKKYNLALDFGSPTSFLTEELFDKLTSAHPGRPRMTGAVGPANVWGLDDERKQKLMRIDRIQFGPLFLTNVPVGDFPKDWTSFLQKRAGVSTSGLVGADVLA